MPIGPRPEKSDVATIAVGQTVSSPVDRRGYAWATMHIPTSFEGASVTFQGCNDEPGSGAAAPTSGYAPIRKVDSDAVVSVTVTSDMIYPIPPEVMACRFFKIVSASAASGTDSAIKLALMS